MKQLWTLAVVALPFSARADVIVVDAGGSGQHTNLQAAVDAALDGDTLLVKAGAYSGFTVDDKSLAIVAETGAAVTVSGSVVVRNLAASRTVVLGGLQVLGATTGSMAEAPGVALIVEDNAGAFRAKGCSFTGAKGAGDGWIDGGCCYFPEHYWGWQGVIARNNPGGVAFAGCALAGGRGARANFNCYCGWGGAGGDALAATDTLAALYECTFTGGQGGSNGWEGGAGGAGARVSSTGPVAGLHASASSLQGGAGGDSYDYIGCTIGGAGGDGLVRGAGTVSWGLEAALAGGAGGLPGLPHLCPPGPAGAQTSGTGSLFDFGVQALALSAPHLARESTSVPMTVSAAPGSRVLLVTSLTSPFAALPSWKGVLLTEPPLRTRVMGLGTVPGSGSIAFSIALGDLGVGVEAQTRFLQAYLEGPGGLQLGSFATLTVLDAAY